MMDAKLKAIVFDTGYGYNIAWQVQLTDKTVWLYQCKTQLMNEYQKNRAVKRLEAGQRFEIHCVSDFYQRIPEALT